MDNYYKYIKGKEIAAKFYENKLQKTYKEVFRFEKVITRKYDKLCVKYKGYNSSFNSCIDKKYIVSMSKYE